jgi:hypothetical protein
MRFSNGLENGFASHFVSQFVAQNKAWAVASTPESEKIQ